MRMERIHIHIPVSYTHLNEKGVESADLLFKSYEIRSGKYQLQGLPAVWADENEAQTLSLIHI